MKNKDKDFDGAGNYKGQENYVLLIARNFSVFSSRVHLKLVFAMIVS